MLCKIRRKEHTRSALSASRFSRRAAASGLTSGQVRTWWSGDPHREQLLRFATSPASCFPCCPALPRLLSAPTRLASCTAAGAVAAPSTAPLAELAAAAVRLPGTVAAGAAPPRALLPMAGEAAGTAGCAAELPRRLRGLAGSASCFRDSASMRCWQSRTRCPVFWQYVQYGLMPCRKSGVLAGSVIGDPQSF